MSGSHNTFSKSGESKDSASSETYQSIERLFKVAEHTCDFSNLSATAIDQYKIHASNLVNFAKDKKGLLTDQDLNTFLRNSGFALNSVTFSDLVAIGVIIRLPSHAINSERIRVSWMVTLALPLTLTDSPPLTSGDAKPQGRSSMPMSITTRLATMNIGSSSIASASSSQASAFTQSSQQPEAGSSPSGRNPRPR